MQNKLRFFIVGVYKADALFCNISVRIRNAEIYNGNTLFYKLRNTLHEYL